MQLNHNNKSSLLILYVFFHGRPVIPPMACMLRCESRVGYARLFKEAWQNLCPSLKIEKPSQKGQYVSRDLTSSPKSYEMSAKACPDLTDH
jgi:hypothetical protein